MKPSEQVRNVIRRVEAQQRLDIDGILRSEQILVHLRDKVRRLEQLEAYGPTWAAVPYPDLTPMLRGAPLALVLALQDVWFFAATAHLAAGVIYRFRNEARAVRASVVFTTEEDASERNHQA